MNDMIHLRRKHDFCEIRDIEPVDMEVLEEEPISHCGLDNYNYD